ncbi:MAG: PAS domain-containing sensor histidine kinase [Sulfuricurvum sp.]|nr:PAS domain-containing sensor histidine kinase [Sulfuricurvum sp.]
MNVIQENISNKYLYYLLEQSDNLISFVDTDYIYRAVNLEYCRKHQKDIDEIIGHYVWEVLGTEQFESIVKPYLLRALSGEQIRYETWFILHEKSKVYLRISYNPCRDNFGEIEGVVVTVSDITVMKKIEDKNRLQEKLLVEQSRMAQLGEMIAFISHQWRQPLNTIATYLLRLRMSQDQNETSRIIDHCEANLEHLSESLDSIYAFYAGTNNNSETDVGRCIERVILLLEERLKRYEISVNVVRDEWYIVEFPTNDLLHVILVIIENAIDVLASSDQKDKRIDFHVYRKNGHIIICIKDNGIGISHTIINKIFEPGFTTKPKSGHGYGLYFAQKVITKDGKGTLEVNNDDPLATHFRIILNESV